MSETNLETILDRATSNANGILRYFNELGYSGDVETIRLWLYNTAIEIQKKNVKGYTKIRAINLATREWYALTYAPFARTVYVAALNQHFVARSLYWTISGTGENEFQKNECAQMCHSHNLFIQMAKDALDPKERALTEREKRYIL